MCIPIDISIPYAHFPPNMSISYPYTPPFTLSAFDPFLHVQLYGVRVKQVFEGIRRLRFRHRIGQVRLSLNPLDLRNLSLFVSLAEAYYINHKSLFSCGS